MNYVPSKISQLEIPIETKLSLISYFWNNPSSINSIVNAGNDPKFLEKHSKVLADRNNYELNGKIIPAPEHLKGVIIENDIQVYPPKGNLFIESVIHKEEVKFAELFERASILKKEYTNITDITSDKLVNLRQTYGWDPTVIEMVFEQTFPEDYIQKHTTLWEDHCKKGLDGLKKAVIKAKTKNETD